MFALDALKRSSPECLVAEARRDIGAVGGGERVWRCRLFAWEEESERKCSVLLHNTVLQKNVHDAWHWLLDPIQGYSVKGAYRFLTTSDDRLDRTLVDDVVEVWKRQHICSYIVIYSSLFGLMFDVGYIFLWFLLVTSNNISFYSLL
uniref:Transmembrane protein n=1 Tax=Medicago truncatula TaxID=3880 RepID=A2Q4I1_MEDTR|nr:hypothetical protein MtrDRAFT_AC157488g19v2 [Medicago truncatula]